MIRRPGPARLLPLATLALVAIVAGACAGTPLAPRSAADAAELERLEARVLELQRQATVTELEVERLRRQVAALERALGVEPPRPAPPPRREPIPRPRPDDSRGGTGEGIVEEDLVEEPLQEVPVPGHRSDDPPPRAVAEPTPPTGASSRTAGPEAQALYDRGYTQYHQGRWVDAESSFQRFLQDHADTELADNAQYWIGEARLARGDTRGALTAFREVVERFPSGNKVPDALLQIGGCLARLGDTTAAREAYREVERRFPGSAAASVAAERASDLP